ncbi:MerR family transcriptional regulator [Burkholderiaceae bacterium UC74_6]
MKIGELAQRSGLAPSRIRFYEASGLLNAVERRENGYRHYGPDALWTLEIITRAQGAGFSLEEIRSLLPAAPGQWQHSEMLEGLRRKVVEIEQLQERLVQTRTQLLLAIETIESGGDLGCADKAQQVMQTLREKRGS